MVKNKKKLQEESAVAVHRIAMAARRYATGSPMLNLECFFFFCRNSANNAADFCHFLFI